MTEQAVSNGRRPVWLALAAVVAVVGGLWFGPRFLDWSGFKPRLESLISKQLGVDVVLRGALLVDILPQPKITAADVLVVGDGVDGSLRWLRGTLDPRGLLFGEILPRDLHLVEADIRLPTAIPRIGTGMGKAVVAIENSRVSLTGGPDWLPQSVERVNGVLSLGGAAVNGGAGLSFDGEVRYQGQPVGLVVEIGRDGYSRIAIGHGPSSGDLVLSGTATADGWQGKGTLVFEEAAFLSTLDLDAATRLVGEGAATMDADIALDAAGVLSLDIRSLESTRLSGKGRGTLVPGSRPAVDLSLTLDRADFETDAPDVGLLSADLSRFMKRNGGVDVTATIEAGSLRLPTGTLRHAVLSLAAGGGVAMIDRASAVLPGQADLSFFGNINPTEDGWWFDGDLALSAGDLRGLLDWALPDRKAVWASLPPDRLKRTELTAHMILEPNSLEVAELTARVDDTIWAGALSVPLGPVGTQDTGTISAVLQGDSLNLDRYRGDGAGIALPDGWLISDRNRHLSFYLDRMIVGGVPIGGVSLDLQAAAGMLPSMDLSVADIVGSRISGRMGLEAQGAAKAQVTASVPAPDRLFGAFGVPARQAATFASFGETEVTLDLSYNPDTGLGYVLDALGSGGDARLNGYIQAGSPVRVSISDGAVNTDYLTVFGVSADCRSYQAGGWLCPEWAGAVPGLQVQGSGEVKVLADGTRELGINITDAQADLGLFVARAGVPLLPEGNLLGAGRLTGRGGSFGAAAADLSGSLALSGKASLSLRRGGGGTGRLKTIRTKLAKTFAEPGDFTGTIAVDPSRVGIDFALLGAGGRLESHAAIDRATRGLTASIDIVTPQETDPALTVDLKGALGAPDMKLNGRWLKGG